MIGEGGNTGNRHICHSLTHLAFMLSIHMMGCVTIAFSEFLFATLRGRSEKKGILGIDSWLCGDNYCADWLQMTPSTQCESGPSEKVKHRRLKIFVHFLPLYTLNNYPVNKKKSGEGMIKIMLLPTAKFLGLQSIPHNMWMSCLSSQTIMLRNS